MEAQCSSDFSNGRDDWSVHGYLKGVRVHCALNRYESNTLIPHSDNPGSRVLQVCNSGRAAAIFPRVSLMDRWVNPTDPTTPTLAMGCVDIPQMAPPAQVPN